MVATIQNARHHWVDFNTWGNDQLIQHREELLLAYQQVRSATISLTNDLTAEDMNLQSMPETSPAKWHLAHTSWFFETFLLKQYLPDYQSPQPDYAQLFNSYYNGVGEQYPRPQRSLLSRPSSDQVLAYRQYIDDQILNWLTELNDSDFNDIAQLVILGLNHEQQHQELLLTDLQHSFSLNPLAPVIAKAAQQHTDPGSYHWHDFPGGITQLGQSTNTTQQGFAYDNETPRHQYLLSAWQLANRPVTNAEYLEFIQAGGYQQAQHWHSDAWCWLQKDTIQAPLYWQQQDNTWYRYSLAGKQALDQHAPVCHVSWYEASAYASWRGCRLPSEAEWEHAANTCSSTTGQFADDSHWQPLLSKPTEQSLHGMFGTVWEWTSSSYSPYPGFCQASGSLGEYNGKFMANQYVLRGGSCATPAGHIRASYRNFFYPQDRWQFTGIRLARHCPAN